MFCQIEDWNFLSEDNVNNVNLFIVFDTLLFFFFQESISEFSNDFDTKDPQKVKQKLFLLLFAKWFAVFRIKNRANLLMMILRKLNRIQMILTGMLT